MSHNHISTHDSTLRMSNYSTGTTHKHKAVKFYSFFSYSLGGGVE